jgi:hypothetical protein
MAPKTFVKYGLAFKQKAVEEIKIQIDLKVDRIE